jgi:3-oxoacyl-[acyl-carrier protein] reductase
VREGASVIIADVSVDGGQRVEREIAAASPPAGATATFLAFDVTKRDAWEKGLALAREKHGRLDIVVNNAGTTYRKKPSVEVTEEEFDRIYNVNVKSVYWSVAVVMPYFVERKAGAYINTSSVAGMKVRPGQVFYGGTKGFLNTVRRPGPAWMFAHWRR